MYRIHINVLIWYMIAFITSCLFIFTINRIRFAICLPWRFLSNSNHCNNCDLRSWKKKSEKLIRAWRRFNQIKLQIYKYRLRQQDEWIGFDYIFWSTLLFSFRERKCTGWFVGGSSTECDWVTTFSP